MPACTDAKKKKRKWQRRRQEKLFLLPWRPMFLIKRVLICKEEFRKRRIASPLKHNSAMFKGLPLMITMVVFYLGCLNPLLSDVEERVLKTTAILDSINKQMEEERKERMRRRLTAHIPEALLGGGEARESVMMKLEQLIFFEEIEGTDEICLQEHVRLQELDDIGHTSVIASSLKSYLSTLEEPELKRVTNKISSDSQLWLSRLFRFGDSCVLYHDDEREGLVRVCRLALCHRYPKYVTDGFDALYSRPPVIYLSAAARPGLGYYLCLQLGLPLSCICTVPCNTMFGASSKMDVAVLEKLIQDDIAAAKTPVLLLAFAGTTLGHVDNLQRLQEICKANQIWLHVEGTHLATLTLLSVPTSVSSAQSGDSLTVTLGTWLGVPGLPNVTIFKESDATLVHAAGLNTFNTKLKLMSLPIWMVLLNIGHEGIVKRITFSCDLAKQLYDHLDQITTVKQISRDTKTSSQRDYRTISDLISKAISALLVFEIANPTVVFRYMEDVSAPGAIVAPYAMNSESENDQSSDVIYFDALNVWLAEALQASDPKVPIETIEVEKEGICIRYCPLENSYAKGTTKEDMEHFIESLLSNISVLNASTLQRKRFQMVVEAQPNLKIVHLQNWAGLGAVRYIPDLYLSHEDLDEKDFEGINSINAELVHQLKAKDTAFSIGHTDSGEVCVKFGLITQETDVEELIDMVQRTGREVEESSKFLESMSELILKGIEEAKKQLVKESEQKLMSEGVLRQVPLVSSLVNWFSPVKDGTKGRSFSLTSGKIVSTEDTYRYHVQIQEEANKSPTTHSSITSSIKGGGEPEEQQEACTTAGRVKAQLISQATPPASPTSDTVGLAHTVAMEPPAVAAQQLNHEIKHISNSSATTVKLEWSLLFS
ncbi:putative pyridoxal-dependent decarboxylase domain-containing protein 2 [Pomacea canaliculata]|uniref:putative pyridoxal-dependent decarboxylase domain-containing protein 2 n=1 Tax=Pomacea canaliculata TaxID=400727 RepID=UPI000D729A1F|nr:putative pyridoxal-dependent decarboxylase domain-containing protein 2 [Pomacea canaliculata]